MKIVIFGIGAMGCLLGSYLSRVCDIHLIGQWHEQQEWLKKVPLRLINTDGSITETKLTTNIRPDTDNDFALILTKAKNTSYVSTFIKKALKPNGIAVTLQNGMGNVDILDQHIPNRAAVGVTMMGATVEGVGTVRVGGYGTTYLATNPIIEERIQQLAELFQQSELPTVVQTDISAMLWGKLAINAAINPLTALLRVTNGALIENPWTRQIMVKVAEEVESVAHAKGIQLPFEAIGSACETVAQNTAHNRSSMLQDVLRGVETEIEAISGAVVREGQAMGISTPLNLMLHNLIKALEDSALKQIG